MCFFAYIAKKITQATKKQEKFECEWIFESLGKFEEDIILNEDTFYVYFAINKGYKIVYKSNAKVYHSHNLSYKEQFSRNFDIGVSQQQKQEIFNSIKSEKEGGKLLKYTIIKLLKGFHFIALIDFIIDCAFRYFGYKTGRKFNTLTIEKCIKYSNNKLNNPDNYVKDSANNSEKN